MLISTLLLTVASPSVPSLQGPDEIIENIHYDWVKENGELDGGILRMKVVDGSTVEEVLPAAVTTMSFLGNGNPSNRVDLVYVGDGYTAGELGTYANHVDSQVADFFGIEPFNRYEPYFNVHRVDVVSNESGVDNDPVQGIERDTALDMGFWCGGTERALCVDVGLAYSYAANAPDRDLIAAVANSTKYGGAGYPTNNLGTAAGGNSAASQIIIHEFGHALGNLADEYTYGGSSHYNGPEFSSANLSIHDSVEMTNLDTKWVDWLGTSMAPFDGTIGTYEGGGYHQTGVYRPSNNSMMRNLGRPFNLVGVEELILEIYRHVNPIDAGSPTNPEYDGSETLFVTPVQQIGAALSVQWFLDGDPTPVSTANQLSLPALGLPNGPHTVTLVVRDTTTWVRDEAARDQWMTSTRVYDIAVGCDPNYYPFCGTAPNSAGPGALISPLGTNSIAANDLVLQATGLPANTNGVFVYSPDQGFTPLGDGFLCLGTETLGFILRLPPATSDAAGVLSLAIDLTDPPNPLGAFAPGVSYHFQTWYRDPAAGGSGFNFSDAMTLGFCP